MRLSEIINVIDDLRYFAILMATLGDENTTAPITQSHKPQLGSLCTQQLQAGLRTATV